MESLKVELVFQIGCVNLHLTGQEEEHAVRKCNYHSSQLTSTTSSRRTISIAWTPQ